MLENGKLEQIVEFHGHMCPGLAMGIQVGLIAVKEVGRNTRDNPVLAVVETNLCPVDGIQYVTGCTFGMGGILYREWGKLGFSFYALKDRRGIRIVAKPGAMEADPDFEEHTALTAKVKAHEATPEEQARFRALHQARAERILDADPYDLYQLEEIDGVPPVQLHGHANCLCDACGEGVFEDCTRRHGGKTLCIPCFEQALAA